MNITIRYILILSTALKLSTIAAPTGSPAADTKPEAGSKAETSKKLNWSFTPDPALPNVLILGDSISIGYTLQVRKLLEGKANVFRPMSPRGDAPQNCSGTTYGVNEVDRWIAGQKWDVIHFNWGLHDLKHVKTPGSNDKSDNPADPVQATLENYSKNLEQIVAKLKATSAKLIFATTTPVQKGTTNPLREPEAPKAYNAAAIEIAKKHGASVNDLFAFCEPQLGKLQLPLNVHFTPEGSQALAGQVADSIVKQLAPPTNR
jgi:acyl-CoA thioesterase-1